MRQVNILVVNGTSDATSFNGSKIDLGQILSGSFQAYFSDISAAGTVKLQFSNDVGAQNNLALDFTPTHWSDVPNGTVTITAGATNGFFLPQMAYRWGRIVWTQTTPGVGLMSVTMNALGI